MYGGSGVFYGAPLLLRLSGSSVIGLIKNLHNDFWRRKLSIVTEPSNVNTVFTLNCGERTLLSNVYNLRLNCSQLSVDCHKVLTHERTHI